MILLWEEIWKGLLPVSQKLGSSLEAGIRKTDIIFKGERRGAAFWNPWKPDPPCLSGFLPPDLVMGGISCAGSQHTWVSKNELQKVYKHYYYVNIYIWAYMQLFGRGHIALIQFLKSSVYDCHQKLKTNSH